MVTQKLNSCWQIFHLRSYLEVVEILSDEMTVQIILICGEDPQALCHPVLSSSHSEIVILSTYPIPSFGKSNSVILSCLPFALKQ